MVLGTQASVGLAFCCMGHFKYIKGTKDTKLRLLIILAEIQSQCITLANISTTNGDEPDFFGRLDSKILKWGIKTFLLEETLSCCFIIGVV